MGFIILGLLLWYSILMTIRAVRTEPKSKKVVCPKCGYAQIATLRLRKNDGYGLINVCQNCGESWDLTHYQI